jgi:hypothetical protein
MMRLGNQSDETTQSFVALVTPVKDGESDEQPQTTPDTVASLMDQSRDEVSMEKDSTNAGVSNLVSIHDELEALRVRQLAKHLRKDLVEAETTNKSVPFSSTDTESFYRHQKEQNKGWKKKQEESKDFLKTYRGITTDQGREKFYLKQTEMNKDWKKKQQDATEYLHLYRGYFDEKEHKEREIEAIRERQAEAAMVPLPESPTGDPVYSSDAIDEFEAGFHPITPIPPLILSDHEKSPVIEQSPENYCTKALEVPVVGDSDSSPGRSAVEHLLEENLSEDNDNHKKVLEADVEEGFYEESRKDENVDVIYTAIIETDPMTLSEDNDNHKEALEADVEEGLYEESRKDENVDVIFAEIIETNAMTLSEDKDNHKKVLEAHVEEGFYEEPRKDENVDVIFTEIIETDPMTLSEDNDNHKEVLEADVEEGFYEEPRKDENVDVIFTERIEADAMTNLEIIANRRDLEQKSTSETDNIDNQLEAVLGDHGTPHGSKRTTCNVSDRPSPEAENGLTVSTVDSSGQARTRVSQIPQARRGVANHRTDGAARKTQAAKESNPVQKVSLPSLSSRTKPNPSPVRRINDRTVGSGRARREKYVSMEHLAPPELAIPAYSRNDVDVPNMCTTVWIVDLHGSRGGCERCLHFLSPNEKLKFDEDGHHYRVNMVRGGCVRSCTLYPRNENESPVRLCRKCYYDTHKTIKEKYG